jgi:hypothetical protein
MNDVIQIISTPLFWIVSAVGSVALGVIGNLLTPKVAAILQRRGSTREHATRKAKAKRMGEVMLRFDRPDKLTQTKLDAIHALLMACIAMLLALVIFTLASALEWFVVPEFVGVAIIIAGIPVLWLAGFITTEGLKFRGIAQTVERRRDALDKFCTIDRTPEEIATFLRNWDRAEFDITYEEARNAMSCENV